MVIKYKTKYLPIETQNYSRDKWLNLLTIFSLMIYFVFSVHLVLYWWIARVGQNVVEVQVPVLTKWHPNDLKELLAFQVVFFYTLGGVHITVSSLFLSWIDRAETPLSTNKLARSAMHCIDPYWINQKVTWRASLQTDLQYRHALW